jgi:cytochrome c oxidase subunit IV
MSYELVGTVLAINLLLQVNALVAMLGDCRWVLKYLHFGSDLAWAVIWYFLMLDGCSQITV